MRTISTQILIVAFTTAAAMAVVPYARPQDADRGQIEFLLNYAGCHGTDAKGSGPQSAKLHTKPVDLTLLAKRNHGRFDPGAVYQMIDGRNARLSHHSAEMPIWGCRHQTQLPTLPATIKRKHKSPKRILSQMKPHENELNSLLDLPCELRSRHQRAVARHRQLSEPGTGEITIRTLAQKTCSLTCCAPERTTGGPTIRSQELLQIASGPD